MPLEIVKITFSHKSIGFYDRVFLIFIATLVASEENSGWVTEMKLSLSKR